MLPLRRRIVLDALDQGKDQRHDITDDDAAGFAVQTAAGVRHLILTRSPGAAFTATMVGRYPAQLSSTFGATVCAAR